jgi:peptidoglycan/LPS O-acetylase OafA/YrhL
MLTALAVAKYWREGKSNGALAGTMQVAGALVLYIMAVYWAAPRPSSNVPVYELFLSAAFALLIFALCTSRTPLARLFGSPVATWLGGISYSIYLIHQPTAWYLSEFFKKKLHLSGPADMCLLATAGLAVVVGVAYPFYLMFEKPALSKPTLTEAEPVPVQPVKEPVLNCPSRS